MDAAFRSAQARWDNLLPDERDDEPTVYELSEARDEFLTDTFATSLWLVENLAQPELSTTRVRSRWVEEDMTELTIDELWVLILSGTEKQLIAARFELVDRMCEDSADNIEARVPAIRAANRVEAAEYLAELQAEAA
jgi:hypothetical protein